MQNVRQALLQRIGIEVGAEFLARIDDNLTATFKASSDYAHQYFGPELYSRNKGNLQQSHILQEVVRAAEASGLLAEMAPTSPKGAFFAKITLPSFIVGGMRVESAHWKNAHYAKDFGRLNKALEPITPDLFAAVEAGSALDGIFMVIAVAENKLNGGLPDIYFAVPFSSLDGYHLIATLSEVKQMALVPVSSADLEPLPRLKKRLDDEERGAKEA